MSIPLRVLIVEDSEDDALLMLRELQNGGFKTAHARVETREAMSAELNAGTWDAVIADYVLPLFSGLDALRMVREKGLDIPFIMVSGKMGEETAVEVMKAGAHDYIVKTNLARLVPAIHRELREAELRKDKKRAEEELREAEAKYRSLVEEALVGVYIIIDGRFAYVNPCLARIFGYDSPDEIVAEKTVADLTAHESRDIVTENLRKRLSGEVKSIHYTFKGICRDGSTFEAEVYGTGILYRGQPAVIGTLMDITERVRAEEHRREFYRRTILAATEGKLEITERDEIGRIAGTVLAEWLIRTERDPGRVRHDIQEIARSEGMDESRIFDFIVCAGEALTNAIKHAGGGTASIRRLQDGLLLIVSDRGPGIPALSLPEVALKKGYSTTGTLGMGYKAMITFADRVYLATGPDGTCVAIQMGLHPQKEEAAYNVDILASMASSAR